MSQSGCAARKPFQSAKNFTAPSYDPGPWPSAKTRMPDVRYVSKSARVNVVGSRSQRSLFGGRSAKSAKRNWLSMSTTGVSSTSFTARAEYSRCTPGTTR